MAPKPYGAALPDRQSSLITGQRAINRSHKFSKADQGPSKSGGGGKSGQTGSSSRRRKSKRECTGSLMRRSMEKGVGRRHEDLCEMLLRDAGRGGELAKPFFHSANSNYTVVNHYFAITFAYFQKKIVILARFILHLL